MTENSIRLELLPNGYVRVDESSGLVRVWELLDDGSLFRRSGYGEVVNERRRVAQVFANAPGWARN